MLDKYVNTQIKCEIFAEGRVYAGECWRKDDVELFVQCEMRFCGQSRDVRWRTGGHGGGRKSSGRIWDVMGWMNGNWT